MVQEPTMMGYINDQGSIFQYCLNHKSIYEETAKKLCETRYKKIYLSGSGSSYHAAVVSRYFFLKNTKTDAQSVMPNLFTYHEQIELLNMDPKEVLVIGISQSGNSLTAISVMEKAKQSGCSGLVITEDTSSRITEIGYPVLQMLCGRERVSPETKGYTCQLFTLYLLSLYMGREYGCLSEEELADRIEEAEKFAGDYDSFLKKTLEWYERNREEIEQAKKIGITGFGVNYGTALEGQLKIYECTPIPAAGYEAEEFIHGHIFAYDKDNYLFTIASENEAEIRRMIRMNDFYKEHITEHVFSVSDEAEASSEKDLCFENRYCEELMAIAYVLPFQVIACKVAEHLGMTTGNFPMVSLDWPARD